ncbi:SRPBCC family protein [Nitratireductor sp. ZSWI3]|uniref:SRPBCC family protein n=1 Tax=Nitratireductor sp. ZSWI3 TaxID=2966359 RepID=UPI00214FF3B6|nr:SRPBCC family protein [Nitratireductor sp. ZSWI3]MCR4269056.1 SRPBCC family protein [Nitratireductor sp. ZSWI3]
MSERSEVHTTFVIERTFRVPPHRVFAAWSQQEARRAWASCHIDLYDVDYGLDFRVGGSEHNRARERGRDVFIYEARFLDIVEDHRIVYAYEMRLGQKRVSVSLATVGFVAAGEGTRMTFTEQVVFLDGHTDGLDQRRIGTEEGFDRLEALLDGETAPRH